METVNTKFKKGDRVRVVNPNDIFEELLCPFCKGQKVIDTGIMYRPPRRKGLSEPERLVLTCKNCYGHGYYPYFPAEPIWNVRKGIWKILSFKKINRVGVNMYEAELVDDEDEKIDWQPVGYTTTLTENELIPESDGFTYKAE